MDLVMLERFLTFVNYSNGPHACWPWQGVQNNGYGLFRVNSQYEAATRWLLGQIRDKPLRWGYPTIDRELACHTCDNPPCVNPIHLYVGTQFENIKDRVTRGRGHSGVRNSVKTHCPRGHIYDKENTSVSKKGERNCRTCQNERRRIQKVGQ